MYAIGGLAVGEPKEEMLNTVHYLNDIMPKINLDILWELGLLQI